MAAILDDPAFASLFIPTVTWARIDLEAGFIGKPDVNIGLLKQLLKCVANQVLLSTG